MTLITVTLIAAALAVIALLALAPSVPARRNPLPGRRRRGPAAHRRTRTPRLNHVPHQ
ncbi:MULTISPECIES: hypothetical protein [unclassified Streptomyces]|uniref:hypothetical protein n=1 Tax=unclassified Streptomyces TaxID=2593676 RepID=UPI00195513C0|nr:MULTISPECIES: hypothetical protein [unclassified Streptomyces]